MPGSDVLGYPQGATEKNLLCLEEDLNPVADTYLCFYNIYTQCLEEVYMSFYGRKHTEDTKKRIRESNLGKKRSVKTRQNISRARTGQKLNGTVWNKGLPAPWNSHPRTEDEKSKITEATRKAMSNLPKEIKDRIKQSQFKSEEMVGKKHWNWQGGISYDPYCPKFNKILKEKIRERDNRTCQLCGIKESGRKLSVHHIHYDKPNCKPDLIVLCVGCNSKVNFNRNYYEKLFMEILLKRNL